MLVRRICGKLLGGDQPDPNRLRGTLRNLEPSANIRSKGVLGHLQKAGMVAAAPSGWNRVECAAMFNHSCLVRMNSSLAECTHCSADHKTTPMQKLPS